jgi:N,N-dimethylformamidase beta subunit-like protein
VTDRLTRSRFVRAAAGAGAALALVPRPALGAALGRPLLRYLTVRNVGKGYKGDRRLFSTVSPGVARRDTARLGFELSRPASVQVEAIRTALRQRNVVWTTSRRLDRGRHVIRWTPDPNTRVGSYVLRLTLEDERGTRRVYGGTRPLRAGRSRAAVVRVLGVEAAFEKRSYAPLEPARLRISADCDELTVQFLHCGTEPEYTDRTDEMRGNAVSEPLVVNWRRHRLAPAWITVQPGPWVSGVYAAKLTTDDGRVGFAPLVLRPPALGTVREAVVIPTNTWQAYNFYDADGDGWGDTWYAGGMPPVRLDRPYRERGTPPRWRRYDVGYLKFLQSTSRTPDMLTDDDLEAMPNGDTLRRLYDLIVFPGHSEYMTTRAYNVTQRFRDLGGRLIFLSANNFFWKVNKRGNVMTRGRLWRNQRRPESGLIGVQYRANDDGRRQAPFVIADTAAAPWLFERTGLQNGSLLGDNVGGYGIEIDTTTPSSPPGTRVLASIPDLFGPGLSAEMAYYETDVGARVFAAGVLDFCGTVHWEPMRTVIDNLWRHMVSDVPAPPA